MTSSNRSRTCNTRCSTLSCRARPPLASNCQKQRRAWRRQQRRGRTEGRLGQNRRRALLVGQPTALPFPRVDHTKRLWCATCPTHTKANSLPSLPGNSGCRCQAPGSVRSGRWPFWLCRSLRSRRPPPALRVCCGRWRQWLARWCVWSCCSPFGAGLCRLSSSARMSRGFWFWSLLCPLSCWCFVSGECFVIQNRFRLIRCYHNSVWGY